MFKNLKPKIELFIIEKGIDMNLVKMATKECAKTLPFTTITFCAAYTLIVYFAIPKAIVKKALIGGIGIFLFSDLLILLAAIGFVLTKGTITDKIKDL